MGVKGESASGGFAFDMRWVILIDARLKYFTTTDKIKLYYELWVPDRPRAIIIFLHGLGDHVGRYGEFTRYFVQKNFGVCMFDMRGHGRSGGRRAHCKSFNDYLKDLSQIIEMVHEHYPNVPLYLIGHSFGGQVAINFVARYSKGLRGLVLLSPNIEPLIKIPNWKKKLAEKMSKFIPIIKLYAQMEPSQFSHDENVVDSARKDPLMNWHVTARLGTEILKNIAALPRLAFQVKVPVLFMHGGDDKITSIEAVRRFYHNVLIQNKDFKTYQGYFHELLNEIDHEVIYRDIENWLNNQISVYKRLARAGDGSFYETRQTPDLWHHVDTRSGGGF